MTLKLYVSLPSSHLPPNKVLLCVCMMLLLSPVALITNWSSRGVRAPSSV